MALRVVHGDTTDIIISTLDEPPYPQRTTPEGISIAGRLGIVRQVGGKTTRAWLFEGEKLSAGDEAIAGHRASYSGEIRAATRKADGAANDAFITDAQLPVGQDLRGAWVIVTHGNGYTHGYEIDRIEKQDVGTVIVLTMDHGLRIDREHTEEVYFPQRTIEGKNTFAIALAATVTREQ